DLLVGARLEVERRGAADGAGVARAVPLRTTGRGVHGDLGTGLDGARRDLELPEVAREGGKGGYGQGGPCGPGEHSCSTHASSSVSADAARGCAARGWGFRAPPRSSEPGIREGRTPTMGPGGPN